MAEQVVIEFVADPSGLKPLVDSLKSLGQLTSEQESLFNSAGKAYDDFQKKAATSTQKTTKEVDDLNKGFQELQEGIIAGATQEFAKQMGAMGLEVTKVGQKSQTLVTQLRQLQNQLAGLEPGTKEFIKLGVEAAKIRDKIEASHKAVRILASDTRALDTFVAAAQGIAGAFAVAQGAAALLGEENEDLQKALLKVQASLAILNGLQAVSETLNKKNVIAVNLNAAAQAAYTTVVGTSTGAMKAFRIALASTGIGLVVIALAALVTNFDKIKSKVTELFPVLNRFGEIWDGIKKNFFGFISGFTEGLSIAKDLLVDFFTSDFSGIAVTASEAGKRLSAAFNKGYIEEEQSQQEERQRVLTQGLIEENKRRLNILEASGKDTFALRKKILEDELKLLSGKEALDKQNEIDVLIAANKKEQADKAKKAAEELAKAQQRIRERQRQEAIEEVEEDDKRQQEKLEDLEEFYNRKAKFIEADATLQKSVQQLTIDDPNSSASAKKAASDEILAIETDRLNKLKALEKERLDSGLIDKEEYAINVRALDDEIAANEIKAAQQAADVKKKLDEEELARKQQLQQAAIDIASETIAAIFEINANNRQAELDDQLAKLNQQREAELSNRDLTEQQRAAIDKKYKQKEAQLKRKAWEDDQNAKITQAVISGALAIVQAFAQLGPIGGAISAVVIAATTAAQIAVMSSQKPPQFAKGTKSAPGGWAVVGEEGEELVHLPQGAKVITHPETKQLLEGKNLDSIITKYNLPSIKREFPEVRKVAVGNGRQAAYVGFDYKKLGEEIAKHPRTLININERGLETRIITENNERILFNQQYSSP